MAEDKCFWEILVPNNSNEGLEYKLEHHNEWDSKVREIAGGLTILRSAKGQWVSPEGKVFYDRMIPVRLYCDEQEMDKIINFTMKHYDQEAVLAYEISSNVKLVYRDK